MASKNKVAVDTNMLLAIPELKVDFFGQTKRLLAGTSFFVPQAVVKELNNLAKKSVKKRMQIGLIKDLMKKNNVKSIKTTAEKADNALVELNEKGHIIATNDKELKKRLKINYLFLRQKKFVELG